MSRGRGIGRKVHRPQYSAGRLVDLQECCPCLTDTWGLQRNVAHGTRSSPAQQRLLLALIQVGLITRMLYFGEGGAPPPYSTGGAKRGARQNFSASIQYSIRWCSRHLLRLFASRLLYLFCLPRLNASREETIRPRILNPSSRTARSDRQVSDSRPRACCQDDAYN